MDAEILRAALEVASGSLLNLEYLPALTNVNFEGTQLHAYDDRCATVVELETGLHCGVRGDRLIDLVKTYRGEVTLTSTDDEVMIKRKGSTVKMPVLSPETFIYQEPDQRKLGGYSFAMDDTFIEALLLANESVGRDSLRPEWAGINLIVGKKGVQLFSTDNMTLVSLAFPDVSPKVVNSGTDVRIIIPRSTVQQIGRVYSAMKGSPQRRLFVTDKYVTATFTADGVLPNVRVVSKLISAEDPFDFLKVIKSYTKGATAFLPIPIGRERGEDEKFGASVKRAVILCGSNSSAHLQLSIEGNILRLNAVGEFGELADRYTLPEAPGDASIKVDPNYVARFLDVADNFAINDKLALCMQSQENFYLVGGRTE